MSDMVSKIDYILRKKIVDSGFSCQVIFDITQSDKLEVVIPDGIMFASAIRFGVDYFFEESRNNKFKVTILEVNGLPPVDTTSAVVFYTMVSALSDHFKMQIPGLKISEDGLAFVVPKYGNGKGIIDKRQ